MQRCYPWMLGLWFAGCPMEVKCATTDPRPGPAPASLSDANDELVRGLDACGYVSGGLRAHVSLIDFEPGSEVDGPCAWQCIADLRDDCGALAELACRGAVPDVLARCVRGCAGCTGEHCDPSGLKVEGSEEDCLDGSREGASYGCARLDCDLAVEELEP